MRAKLLVRAERLCTSHVVALVWFGIRWRVNGT